MAHALSHVQHHRAAEQQRLEFVGVADRRRVEQVLVRALRDEGRDGPGSGSGLGYVYEHCAMKGVMGQGQGQG